MRVKFLQDFRGRETHEIYYQAGDIVDIDPVDLIKRGICEPVKKSPEPEIRATESPTKEDEENEKILNQVHDKRKRSRNS